MTEVRSSIMADVTALYENFDLIHSDRLVEQLGRTTTNNNVSVEYGNLAKPMLIIETAKQIPVFSVVWSRLNRVSFAYVEIL